MITISISISIRTNPIHCNCDTYDTGRSANYATYYNAVAQITLNDTDSLRALLTIVIGKLHEVFPCDPLVTDAIEQRLEHVHSQESRNPWLDPLIRFHAIKQNVVDLIDVDQQRQQELHHLRIGLFIWENYRKSSSQDYDALNIRVNLMQS